MNDPRGNLYLFSGLIAGLALGLLVSLVFSPVRYRNVAPSVLDAAAKDDYRRVIALAYAANHNLFRARERLSVLDGADAGYLLASQAQRMLAENGSVQEARALAILAADLANPSAEQTAVPALRTATPISETSLPASNPESSPTPAEPLAPSFTPLPSATPQQQSAMFVLQSREEICDGSIAPGLLQVFVNDTAGNPLPGAQITVTWQAGEETFSTGLAPELGAGYADYLMQAGETYTLQIRPLSELVEGLSIPGCGGGWRIAFRAGQP